MKIECIYFLNSSTLNKILPKPEGGMKTWMFLTAKTGRDWKCLKVDCPVSQTKISEFPVSTKEKNDKTYIILLVVN